MKSGRFHWRFGVPGFAAVLMFVLTLPLVAQQVPSPQTAAQVPGPASGNTMTRAYVQAVGRMAYLWGWPLVKMYNRYQTIVKLPESGLLGGIAPVAYNGLAMLTDYMSPDMRAVTCPNQDVVYGTGFLALDKTSIVLQVPDFGDRFWLYQVIDARTDEISQLGKQWGTKPGFYLLVGPDWKGPLPSGINAVVRSSTPYVWVLPRVFLLDTPKDHAAIQPLLSQMDFYPLAEFDGKTKTHDWNKLPHYPGPPMTRGEIQWVVPERFFEELPVVMKQIPPLPGEESLYRWIGSLLEAAAKDPEVKQTLQETAAEAEHDLITPLFAFRYNGRAAGNGWNSPVDNGEWGTDYLNRTAGAKSNMFDNQFRETKYFYTDYDSKGVRLSGSSTYAITFPKGQTPPVKGIWSLTLYNDAHFFQQNPLGRYSLGTKNKTLKYNPDGSLTLYAGAKSPGKDKESNWLPAPDAEFSLYLRAYWPDEAVLSGTWQPPVVSTLP